MNHALDLSILLLVWRDRALLRACLEAIAAARDNLSLEIIIVENGITLQTEEYQLAETLRVSGDPQGLSNGTALPIQFIHNSTNRGIAPARNQGLRVARGRYLLLLDVDTRVAPDALANLVRFMDAHPDVGLAGARLQDAQGELQFTCRKLPTVWSKLLRRIPLRWAQDALADEMLTAYDHRTPRDVDYVIGACQIIRHEAYMQVGALDEQFFYGPEDVDYCIRMWRRGWRVMYVPQAVVTHDEQRLTKQRVISRLSLIHAWSLAHYFWKYRYLFTPPRVQIRTSAPSAFSAVQ